MRLRVVEQRIGKVVVEATIVHRSRIRRLPGLGGETPDIDRVSASLNWPIETRPRRRRCNCGSRRDEVDATVKIADESRGGRADRGQPATARPAKRVSDCSISMQCLGPRSRRKLVLHHIAGTARERQHLRRRHHVPLYALGDSIDLYAARSNVDAGTVNAGTFALQVSGKGSAYGVRYNQDVGTLRGIDSKLIYGFDYRSYDDDVSLGGIPLGNQVVVHPVGVTYAGRWAGASSNIGGYVGASFNVPGGENGSEVRAVHTGATANYSILRYGADYTQNLRGTGAAPQSRPGSTHDQLIRASSSRSMARRCGFQSTVRERGLLPQRRNMRPICAPPSGRSRSAGRWPLSVASFAQRSAAGRGCRQYDQQRRRGNADVDRAASDCTPRSR